MQALQLLCKPRPGTLLLVLCVMLGIGLAQEDGEKIISVSMSASKQERADEFLLSLTAKNNVDKCVVVKASIEDNQNIEFLYTNPVYTACVCEVVRFFWEIIVHGDAVITGKAEVVSDDNICPENEDVYFAISYKVSAPIIITVTS